MNNSYINTRASNSAIALPQQRASRIPLWLKLAYTGFISVLIPIYLHHYGSTNFLYFCDVALLLTLAGIWTENKLLISMPAVGILVPQALWVVDFAVQLTGHSLTGMTAYMFDVKRPLYLRGLSLFHGWLPFLLIFLVTRVGYDRRAFAIWTVLAWSLCLVSFFFLPPAGANLPPQVPVNIDYVYGFNDATPQSWLPPGWFLAAWMLVLATVGFAPTHFILRRFCSAGIVTK